MRLLLDTHALLWLMQDSPSLGAKARALLTAPETVAHASVVSIWEVAIKARIGRLNASAAAVDAAIAPSGLVLLGLAREHVLALADLRVLPEHRDPFDHMLVAQALHEGMAIMTADPKLGGYGVPVIGCA